METVGEDGRFEEISSIVLRASIFRSLHLIPVEAN
jgi:hypothetical protein